MGNGQGVPSSNPVPDTKDFLLRHGKTLSCEETESLVVRNPPKTVGPGLD